jgi:predicted signal transduction protein with EAL and GGDEF domain
MSMAIGRTMVMRTVIEGVSADTSRPMVNQLAAMDVQLGGRLLSTA